MGNAGCRYVGTVEGILNGMDSTHSRKAAVFTKLRVFLSNAFMWVMLVAGNLAVWRALSTAWTAYIAEKLLFPQNSMCICQNGFMCAMLVAGK